MVRRVSVPPGLSAMDDRDRLQDLGERLDRARSSRKAAEAPPSDTAEKNILRVALGLGMRFGVEMVVALGMGLGVGWLVDWALGTKPWGMVVFLVLGAAAGIMNVWRALTGQGFAVGFRRPDRE